MKPHIKEMHSEFIHYEKLATTFLFFKYRQRFGWSFDHFVKLFESNKLDAALGNDVQYGYQQVNTN